MSVMVICWLTTGRQKPLHLPTKCSCTNLQKRFALFCKKCLQKTAEEHGTTKKIPAEVFAIEKDYLIPVSEYSFAKPSDDSISYQVRKDNVVLYKCDLVV